MKAKPLEFVFADKKIISKIQCGLPMLFQIAEIESSRAGKIGMEVGSIREQIIVGLFTSIFDRKLVCTEIPINKAEIDLILDNRPISIKTKSGRGYAGVKLIWTVDPEKAREFMLNYSPSCDIIYAQIIWGTNEGGLFHISLDAQKEVLRKLGRENYIKLPKAGTNPRGAEISNTALSELIQHEKTSKISIEWFKKDLSYKSFERWEKEWLKIIL